MSVLWYLFGVVTPFIAYGLFMAVVWSISKSWGGNGCQVCDHGVVCEVGEWTNLHYWTASYWHKYFWSYRKWHREAWANHKWNPKNRTGRV